MGGEIGKMADRCYLQKRVLNRSKVSSVMGQQQQQQQAVVRGQLHQQQAAAGCCARTDATAAQATVREQMQLLSFTSRACIRMTATWHHVLPYPASPCFSAH
jgi:tRNA U34 5-carboxymethylaminomethyl modifying enzyme MnmG/GidA